MLHVQERLLSLIAGHLLDVNAKGGVSEEQAANMARIMADAVELLPKLTTGIDVNVIFNDIRGFEVHLCWLGHCLAPAVAQDMPTAGQKLSLLLWSATGLACSASLR